MFFSDNLKIQKNQWQMLEGFHIWTQNAISKIQIFKQFSDFIFELQNLLILKIMLAAKMQLTNAGLSGLAVEHILDCFG